jgi:hypothetical protein
LEHEFKVDSPIVIDRILSRNLGKCSEQLRNEIIPDTTPVPFFGDFENATIVSIGINPSSEEFPKIGNDRRLSHLSDLDLPLDYYQKGLNSMTYSQALSVSKSLLTYFETNPYRDWFDLAEIAVNGANSSYYKSEAGKQKVSCHFDVFPWTTKRFTSLEKKIQDNFIQENLDFFINFLSQKSISEIIVLGRQAYDLFNKLLLQSNIAKIELISKVEKSVIGDTSKTEFKSEYIDFSSHKVRLFSTSKGPSYPLRVKGLSKKEKDRVKTEVHMNFSNFIKNTR